MSLRVGAPLPSLSGATSWLNCKVDDQDLRGRPVLVHFWAMSCPACKDNMPVLQGMVNRFTTDNLAVVAVHLPRNQTDMDVDKVAAAVKALGMTEPCAVDNQQAIAGLFETDGKWPWYFLFDREARLKRRAAGSFGLKMMQIGFTQLFGS